MRLDRRDGRRRQTKWQLRLCRSPVLAVYGQIPRHSPTLERADGLLAAGVDELDVRLAFLALVLAVGEDPGLDLLAEFGRECRVLVESVLEARGKVDLGATGGWELVEHVVRQGAGTVLDCTGDRKSVV